MASLRERLEYVITVDSKQAIKSLEAVGKTTEKELSRTESKLDKASVGLTKFGAGAVGVAGVAGVALYKLGSAASDVEESINAVNVTFGQSAKGVLALSDAAARGVGLSKAEFNGLAVSFAGFAKQLDGNVAQSIDDITTRAADFASVMNMDVNEAARIFQSTLAGESEAMRRFGKDMSAAAVEAYALENGLASSASEMTEGIKVQARYGLLMQETAEWADDFANTSDGAANSQRIMTAELKNAASEIGAGVLPVLTTLVSGLASATSAFGDLPGPAKSAVGTVLTFGTAALGTAGAISFVAGQAIKFRDNLTPLVGKLRDADGGLTKVGKAAKFAGGGLAVIAGSQLAFDVLNEIGDAAGNVERKLQALTIALGDAADEADTGEAAMAAFRDAVAAEGKGLKLSNIWEDFGKEIKIVGGSIGRNIEEIDRAFDSLLSSSPEQAQRLLDVWESQAEGLDKSGSQYRDNLMLIERYQPRIDLLAGSSKALAAETSILTDETEDLAVATDAAAESNEAATKTHEDLTAALKSQYDAVRDATDATLTYEQSVIDLEQGVDGYREALAEANADSEITREELLELASTHNSLKSDVLDSAAAFAEAQGATEGSTKAAELQIQELQRLKLKFPELAQFIDAHVAKLNAIPKNITTTVTVVGNGTIVDENGNVRQRRAAPAAPQGRAPAVMASNSLWQQAVDWWTGRQNQGSSGGGGGMPKRQTKRERFEDEFRLAQAKHERGTYSDEEYAAELRRLGDRYRWAKLSEPGMAIFRELKRIREAIRRDAEGSGSPDAPTRDPWDEAGARREAIEARRNLNDARGDAVGDIMDGDPSNDSAALDRWADAIWRDIEARADVRYGSRNKAWARWARAQLTAAIAANPFLGSRLRVFLAGIPQFPDGNSGMSGAGTGGNGGRGRGGNRGQTSTGVSGGGGGAGAGGGVTLVINAPNAVMVDRKAIQEVFDRYAPQISKALTKYRNGAG